MWAPNHKNPNGLNRLCEFDAQLKSVLAAVPLLTTRAGYNSESSYVHLRLCPAHRRNKQICYFTHGGLLKLLIASERFPEKKLTIYQSKTSAHVTYNVSNK